MHWNWKALAPYRPLTIADARDGGLYERRPGEGAEAIHALLDAGLERPVAIVGPAGAGKSTELAVLAHRRASTWVGPLVRLDKLLPYSDATSADDVLEVIAVFAAKVAIETLHLKLTASLASEARTAPPDNAPAPAPQLRGFDRLLATVREIRSASQQGRVALLVDGLEKASTGLARRVLAQLERLRGEASVVVVVPTSVATGREASVLGDYHVMSIGAVVVSTDVDESVTPASATEGVRFLCNIAARRLGVELPAQPTVVVGSALTHLTALADLQPIMFQCAVLSGGLVRTFLQLLEKGALYAAMQGRDAPEQEDIERTARDQERFLLRLLEDGDAEELSKAHGTSGREVPIERRVRFLANGLLLEYETPRGTVARVAPLLASAVGIAHG